MCSKPHFLAKEVNSTDANCGPLSDIRTSGTPYLANIDLRALLMPVGSGFGYILHLDKVAVVVTHDK